MHGQDSGPHGPCELVLVLHEGGEEQGPLSALEKQLGRHPDAGAGTKEHEVSSAAPHLPAEHESVGPW
jgi:hypothetical protein